MALVIKRTGGNSSMKNWMHYWKPEEEDGDATLDDIMGILIGAAKQNGK